MLYEIIRMIRYYRNVCPKINKKVMQSIQHGSQFLASTLLACLVAVFITILSILFPLTSLASTETVDVSNNDCASSGSSQTESSLRHFAIGIVSVSGNGADWAKNSCLGSEIHHFNSYALYVSTNYPSSGCHTSQNRANAYNCGYNLGLFDVGYAASKGAHSNTWFLDVEGGPGSGIPWSTHSLDSSFLYGLASSLQTRGVTVIGYYSTASMWQSITGGWHSGNYAWYATGANGMPPSSVVRSACHNNFTGGPVVYYQYIIGGLASGIDYDGSC